MPETLIDKCNLCSVIDNVVDESFTDTKFLVCKDMDCCDYRTGIKYRWIDGYFDCALWTMVH